MKLPVFKAVGATYSLVFGNLITCIQIVWLPLAIFYGAIYWFALKILPLIPGLIHEIATIKAQGGPTDPEQIPMSVLLLFGPLVHAYAIGMLLMLLVFAIITAGLLRFVMRGQRPRLPFYLGFGADELRLIGTWFLLVLLVVAVEFLGGITVFLASAATSIASQSLAIVVSVLACIALFAFLLWFALRLSLAGAGAIAERGIGIGPSWKAGKGNSLNLLGFWILLILPLIAGGMVVGMIICAVVLPDLLGVLSTLPIHNAEPDPQQVADTLTKILGVVQAKLPVLFGISFVARLIMYPIIICGSGVAYRLILNEDEEEAAEEDAHAH